MRRLPLAEERQSETMILAGCRARDPEAASALVRLHQPPLLRAVGRLVGRRSVAEEIVQEAFFRTFQGIDRIDPARGARPWLWRVALNLARKHVANHGTSKEHGSPLHPDDRPLFAAPVADPARSQEDRQWLRNALDRLPPKLREVFVLHHVEELSFAELSQILRTPVPALRMRALRARGRLRAMLIEEGRA